MNRTMGYRLVLAAVAVTLAASQAQAKGLPIDQAMTRSKKTGQPMLVLATTDTCPPCVMLKKRLESEPELQPLLSQYVCMDLKVGSTDWMVWCMKHKMGQGTPMVWIVDADGKELYARAGAPGGDGLKKLLETGLAQAGEGRKKIGSEKGLLASSDAKKTHPEKKPAPKPPKRAASDDGMLAAGPAAPQASDGNAAPDDKAAAGHGPSDYKKVASYLRMANAFASTRPEKSKEYAQKVIDLLPDSDEAREARELLAK